MVLVLATEMVESVSETFESLFEIESEPDLGARPPTDSAQLASIFIAHSKSPALIFWKLQGSVPRSFAAFPVSSLR